MEKIYKLELTEDQVDTLIMGLRYLELHHPIAWEGGPDYRPQFKKLLDFIYHQAKQLSVFQGIAD